MIHYVREDSRERMVTGPSGTVPEAAGYEEFCRLCVTLVDEWTWTFAADLGL